MSTFPTPPTDAVPGVTERGFYVNGHLVMCTQTAVVRGAHNCLPAIPATKAEAIRLYKLSDHASDGGTTDSQLEQEITAAYGKLPPEPRTHEEAFEAAKHGAVVTVAVNYSKLRGKQGSYGDLVRWDRGFAAKPVGRDCHEMSFSHATDSGYVWLVDPLGPEGWAGEYALFADIHAAALAEPTWRIWPKGAWETDMLETIAPSARVFCKPGASLRVRATKEVHAKAWAIDPAWPVGTWGVEGPDQVVAVQLTKGGPITACLYPADHCTLTTEDDVRKAVVSAQNATKQDIKAKAVAASTNAINSL